MSRLHPNETHYEASLSRPNKFETLVSYEIRNKIKFLEIIVMIIFYIISVQINFL